MVEQAFLDRAAAVGIKVQYGMVGSERWGNTTIQREVLLIKDHPAVMSVYIADEPDAPGSHVLPGTLKMVYQVIEPHSSYNTCL